MTIEQIYTGCISHAAYYVESDGEAAIFDPLRDVDSYCARAEQDGAVIKYIFETHFHADFVSGHLDLQQKSGGTIVFGPTAQPTYKALIATDGQIFKLGKIQIKVLHTPGHTMESTTYLIRDEQGEDCALLTGDTLFIGDVGRPDLVQYVKSEITEQILARHLFQSLRTKIMPLADHLVIYPNHGAGSACGKKMSKETTDTLGNQKKTNYALRADMTEAEFVDELLTGLTPPPGYFPKNVLMNIQGYTPLETVLEKACRPLSLAEFKEYSLQRDVLILDTRSPQEFSQGFIPGSLNIGLNGAFAVWVGEVVKDIQQKMVLVTEQGKEKESLIRLSRIGYDQSIGFLHGGIEGWKQADYPLESIERIDPSELKPISAYRHAQLVDVRKCSEVAAGYLADSQNIPLHLLEEHLSGWAKDRPLVVYCAGGYRSMIAASLFKKQGYSDVSDVLGGYAAMVNEGDLDLVQQ